MQNNTIRKIMTFLFFTCLAAGYAGRISYVKADTPITTYYVGGDGATDSNTGEGPYATLAKAIDVINGSGGAVNTVIVQGDTNETNEINIHKNVTVVGGAVSGSAIIACPAVNVYQDGSLTLGNPYAASEQELVIDCYGNGYVAWGAVYNYGGLFILDHGVTIQNDTRVGVNNDGTMLMKGGIIQDCRVGITNSMYLTMTGGSIRNNHNNFSGGGVMNFREFTMSGGTICDNTSNMKGGGVYNFSSFHMGGNAVITRNSAASGGGIYDDNEISYAYGALYFGDDMTISGGTISDNTAAEGGGIYAGSSFELSGSASIPSGSTRSNDVYLCDRLVVKNDWNFSEEIAFTAPIYCEGLRLLEINPALLTANHALFYLENEKYDLTYEGKLTLKDWSNVSIKYVNGDTGDDYAGDGSSSKPYATLLKAVADIESTADRTGIIYLQSDIELAGTVNISGDITLLSQGEHNITRSDTFTGCMMEVHGSLKLGAVDNSGSNQQPSIIFDGESDHGRTATGAVLYNEGILDMYNGVIIQNNNRPVTVDWGLAAVTNRNIFNMHGGMIRGNTGSIGGVFSDKTFRMEGSSSIQDNTGIFNNIFGSYGFGGVCTSKYFCMTGGTITNNTGDEAGGVYCYYYNGYFDMKGGEISGNSSGNQGGGVNNFGVFHMSGGIITGNQSGTGYSDGVYQSSTLPLTLSGNAIITPDNAIGIDYSWKDSGEMSVTEIRIDGTLTGTLPDTGEPSVFKVNNDYAVLGTAMLTTGADYHFTREDSLRFICNNSQPEEYGTDEAGRLCPLLSGENITIPHKDIFYNGSARQIDNIAVSYNDTILTENVDYRIIYSNNINTGVQALVTIRGIGSYSGEYSETFTIQPCNVLNIITVNPEDRIYTAGQQMTIEGMRELLPGSVEVNTGAGIVTLPIIWSLSSGSEFSPKGGSYQFTGSLDSNPNYSFAENTFLTASFTVEPVIPAKPVFSRADIPKAADKSATPSELGEALLPTTGYTYVEGYQLDYSIDWEDAFIDTTDVAALTTFTGTIHYLNEPEWITLPQDLTVSRTIGVYRPIEEISGENITIPHKDIFYNGSARQIDNIAVSDNGTILTENVDYRITYSNNINAGDQALVTIRGIGYYSGEYSEFFTINLSNVLNIITLKPEDRIYTAGQQMTIEGMRGLFPSSVEVNTDAGIVTLPMIWNLSGGSGYNPKGGSYQFTGSLASNPNYRFAENTFLTASVTVDPAIPAKPVFSRADIIKASDKSATPSELGETLLPTTGYTNVEGYQLGYSIDWEEAAIDTTDVAALTAFTGTIHYLNPPEWVTLPEDLSVSRIIGVYELMEETLRLNGSEVTYPVRISGNVEQGSLVISYDITKSELLQTEKKPYDSLLSQINIAVADNAGLLELVKDAAYKDVELSLIFPADILYNPEFYRANINLDPELLKAVKASGKDITVSVKDESGREAYSWTISGEDLANSKHELSEVNLSLSVVQVIQNEELKDLLTDNGGNSEAGGSIRGLVINFGHQGVLPSQAGVRIYIGNREDLKPGDKVYLYHVNVESGLLETLPYSSGYTVDKDGYITISIIHCSEYAVLPEKADDSIIISLRNQILVKPASKTLNLGEGQNLQINIDLPETLEIVDSLDEITSSNAIGAVKVKYSSTNPGIVSVNEDGTITANGIGTAQINVNLVLYSGKVKVVTIKIKVVRHRKV